jgi:DNA polymerase I-like protein with 3'-5' exonuclease and polymerase domains
MNWRGSMLYTAARPEFGTVPETPLLPIIHPAAILRAWYLRDVTIHDLKTRIPLALNGNWRRSGGYTVAAPPSFATAERTLKGWLDQAVASPLTLAVDIETSKGLITCIGLAATSYSAISIPFVHKTDDGTGRLGTYWPYFEEAELIWLLRLVLTHPNIRIVGQNFVYDTQYIQRYFGVTPDLYWDTMLCQNVIYPGTPKDLGYLSSLYCQHHWYWKDDAKEWDGKGSLEQLLEYNAMDCMRTWEIAESQMMLVKHLGMEAQMQLKMDTSKLCLRMMNRGVLIDKRRRDHTKAELEEVLHRLHSELLQIIPQEWIKERTKHTDAYWFTSDKQTKEVLYDLLGFKTINNRKTGRPTTGKEALAQFKRMYPQFYGLLNRLDIAGSVENTVNVLKSGIDYDGRMRCSYNPAGAETHRLSSSTNAFGGGTNFQNITKGEEDD